MPTPAPLQPLFLLSDEPIDGDEADDLGRDEEARLLAEIVLGTRGPFTIGIYAQWGTGKTSLLNRVRRLMEAKDEGDPTGLRYPYVVPVFFNAWQYEREAEPLAHLAKSVYDAAAAHLKAVRSPTDELGKKAVAWIRSAHLAARSLVYATSIETRLDPTDEMAKAAGWQFWKRIPVFKFSSKDAIDRYETLSSEQGNPSSKVWKEHVDRSVTLAALGSMRANDQLLDRVRPGNERRIPRIVVFVDDLDRCAAKDAVKVLQGIKLALAQPGFVFVITLNPETLKPYIREASALRGQTGADAADVIYLDKLVQLPYPLKLRDEQFATFARTLVESRLKEMVPDEQYALFVKLRPALRDSSDGNPRTLKRRINALLVDARLAPKSLLDMLNPVEADARVAFLGLCLLHQTARHLGSADLLARLAVADDLCQRIAARGLRQCHRELNAALISRTEAGGVRTLDAGQPASALPVDVVLGQHAELLEALNAVPPLDALFREDFGRRWLANRTVRDEIARFYAQRPELAEINAQPPEPSGARLSTNEPPTGPTDALGVGPPGGAGPTTSPSATVPEPGSGAPSRKSPGKTEIDVERAIIERAAREALHLSESEDLTADHWSKVMQLNLSRERISDAGLAWLTRPGSGLTALSSLVLGSTNVTDAGVEALARPDSGLTALSSLVLSFTRVTDAGVEALARPDSGLKALSSLDLTRTRVTDAGVEALARPDSGLKALAWLYLTNTKVTDAGVKAFQEVRTKLKVIR